MEAALLPIVLFILAGVGLGVGLLTAGAVLAPRRASAVKAMPYESGMDPIHDTHRHFDVRFHLVAIAFVLFDVEVLFLYPWAVASGDPNGIDLSVSEHLVSSRLLVFGEVMFFVGLLAVGLVYIWRKGVLQWR